MTSILFTLWTSILSAQPLVTPHTTTTLGSTLHYLEAGPPRAVTVLLLHGGRFTSDTWLELGTISTLAEEGHHVVAVDLPGYGQSDTSSVPRHDYLHQALADRWPNRRVIIVSPSMSGGFSLPFVATHPERVVGFVPVAPGGVAEYRSRLANVDVPALVVWGEHDDVIPVS